ncbi:LegC family aminotransferase [Uliginosibacterium sp. H1]|uniref:LegC family aminotransferase n=1 Tax=Uliginosibacterium sp. H1 TaxID=3114757 RepID=UPI002E17E04D|nr:LegC family aminotransferase [Uliginosibacterium sp. H1]
MDLPALIEALRRVLPERERIALHEPEFGLAERQALLDCLDSGYVSSIGKYVDRFEQELAAYTGASHVVAVVNGTAALHIALKLAGVEQGDEVLMPALSFVATANAATYCGARPHFVDSEFTSLGLDAAAMDEHLRHVAVASKEGWRNRETGAPLAAIVPMHTFGHPVDLDALVALSERWHIPLVEDAAESLGSVYKGRHTGRAGRISALSFNGNKIITTGGGGAILTEDAKLAERARHITTTARVGRGWTFQHDEAGYNYRMPNLNAALGCAQLTRLPAFVEEKRALAARYREALHDVAGLKFVAEPADTCSNYWLCAVLLDEARGSTASASCELRDAVLQATNELGIMTRPAWDLLHTLPMYADCPRAALPVAEALARRLINLPSSPQLGRV